MSETDQTISLQDAADRLGVHYMTIYRYVRLGLLPAHKEGGTWRVYTSDLDEFRNPSSATVVRGETPWSERLEGRMLAGDVSGAWGVVEASLASGVEPRGVYVDMLAPALASIGDKWAGGEIGVGDEHLASAVATRIIGRLGPRFSRRGRPRGTVVTAMPSGDRHGFGVSMLADVLRGAGYTVLDLGPDTPVASLVHAVREASDVTAVCISVVFDEVLGAVAEMIDGLRAATGTAVPIVLGGRAVLDADHAVRLGADGWAADPAAGIALIESLTGRPTAGGAAGR